MELVMNIVVSDLFFSVYFTVISSAFLEYSKCILLLIDSSFNFLQINAWKGEPM